MKDLKQIVVFCGSSEGSDPVIRQMAYALGERLAKMKIGLVYGAARIGLMGQLAKGALDAGGEVIGVIPEFLMKKEVYHPGLTKLIVTRSMHERKRKMHELSDAVIAMPGGFGTLEELFEMITWAQLGLHGKPMGLLNCNGFYDELLLLLKKMVQLHFLKKQNFEMLLVDHTIDGLIRQMQQYIPMPMPKWIQQDQL